MAILQRVQWTLFQLGLVKTWTQVLFLALLLLVALWGFLRQSGMDAEAKSSSEIVFLPFLNDKTGPAPDWNTLYEPQALVAQAPVGNGVGWGVKTQRKTPSEKASESGETLFLQTYQLLNSGNHAQALEVAQTMVERFPNFQLGQLMYADLMAGFSGGMPEREALLQQPEVRRRLSQLKAEALQRTRHQDKTYFVGKYPAPLRYLSHSVSKVVVVDAQKSRLYVLSRPTDALGESKLQVVFDAYVSIGNNGMGKWREGDGKTPAGVYFVQKHLTDPMLPDLYGSGALTLDYPSPIDKELKRTGSGIWLHGSPSEQYARPPTATDGCVVLANDDMTRLVQLGLKADTPVIIAEQLTWHDAPKASPLKAPPKSWPEPEDMRKTPGDWQLISAFEWTDKQNNVAVLSHELQAPGRAPKRLHSYWVMDGKQWKEVGRPG
ncbi:MAG: hypothetical protein CFE38_18110 [Comamonadaceae bacterium PBBC1]|nr:MAG: hypothetical protein CFE38_18110 [Comamonadaceae bacterium PBBC1]